MSETPEQMTALIARVNSAGREATSHTGRAMRDAVYCAAAPRLAAEVERLTRIANSPDIMHMSEFAESVGHFLEPLQAKLRAVEALTDELAHDQYETYAKCRPSCVRCQLTAILTPQEGEQPT